ncbi:histone-lysine N-methyltransferase ATXR3 isoform X2 [Silene latifolia]
MIEDGKTEAKPVKRSTTKRMKLKRDVFFKKEEPEKEKAQVVVDNAAATAAAAKDEVEEGELGTLKSPKKEVVENGEVTRDIEKGEIVCDKAEFYTEKWRERQEFRREYKWRGVKDEVVEKGEFIPERWQQYKGDGFKEEYGGYSKNRERERERRRYDRDWAPPPPPIKYSAEDYSPGNRNSKSVANWEFNQERNYSKMNSKLMDDLGSCYNKHDYSQGKTHFSNNNGNNNSNINSNNRLKRQGTDSDSSDRKVYDDATDFGSFKSRRLSGEGHYSRHSADKSFRNPNSVRPVAGAAPCDNNKLSSRHYDSSSSRGGYDRYRRSPSYSEKSPPSRERGRYHDHRERTPVRHERSPGYRGHRHDSRPSPSYSERSPHGRGRVYDRRERSPSYLEWSPHDRGKVYDRRERSPSYLERSPQERSRSSNNHSRQSGRKGEQNDKAQDVKLSERNFNDKDFTCSIKDSRSEKNLQNGKVELSLDLNAAAHESQSPCVDGSREEEDVPHLANGVAEELLSMEEDMDICDTPPHVPSLLNLNPNPGKWHYIDHYGEERGPSRLGDLKVLVEEGLLMSDHLIKHSDSDRWVTVENAASPIVSANFSTVVQQVSLPVAPGNVHVDFGDAEAENEVCMEEGSVALGKEDLNIDERVGALLEGVTVIPGKELEVLGEVFQMTFDQSEWDKFGSIQGIVSGCPCSKDPSEVNQDEDIQRYPVVAVNDSAESTSTASFDKEYGYFSTEFNEWFSGRWTCKGGDWQRNDDAAQDKLFRRKYVLNDGYPLCQMSKSGYEDPRWQRQDDLYYPCQSTKLELPAWAICWSEERNDSSAVNKAGQIKPLVRGVKGTMLPVIRINACVLQDHGSIVSDSRSKQRGKDKYTSRGKHYPLSSDVKRLSEDDALLSKCFKDENAVVNKPQDRVCTVDDLQLHLGDWFYLDGAGLECGPFLCSELNNLVDDGCLKMQSSVVRKIDNVWAPVTSVIKASEGVKLVKDTINLDGEPFDGPSVVYDGSCSSSSFHNVHPQFIGYTLGKLHELVMKSYKSREFAAAINEFLDPWISSRQPKKEMEKHKLLSKGFLLKPVMENECSTLHEDDVHGRKRCRTLTGGVDEEYEISEVLPTCCYSDVSFDDLCSNVAFCKEGDGHSETAVGSWGLLDGHILSRIFHFLRSDVKSLVFAASTCKHWRDSVGFYKNMSIRVDLSTVGANCSDSTVESIMRGYSKEMIKALVLDGCINISSLVLEEILQSFTCISSVEIKGCNQFEELIIRFPNVTWVKERRTTDESYFRTRSLKQISEQASSVMKSSHESYVDESSGLKDYFERVEKRGANNQSFRQITYKRTKIGDTRKSALVQAREARMRHLAMKKAGCGYRKMEEFLVLSLKEITKENASNYLVRKVAEIENRVKIGYYSRRGMRAAKQDVLKMYKEAVKKKNRADGSDMNHVFPLLTKLLAYFNESCDTAMDEDDVMRKPRDGTSGYSGNKKHGKIVSERKSLSRMNNTFSHNGGSDYVECLSEREIGYKFPRMNKKVDSDSESSDEYELSSDEFGSDSRSRSRSVSDTASDSDVQSESNNTFESQERYYLENEAFDFIPDDREWGARMTKASLVPPVTRKYEVIDQYVIVADEVEVQRKMQVSLPDDYEDKVRAQKNGSEVDMDIPEVKEYKPRKKLGEQVIEQEVYGIDPYTYNLLLDSMSTDVDWPLVEKHKFIEDVVLRELNRQVRHYTGSESTPMTYHLKPVIEEILKTATAEHNTRNVKLCKSLLQAMHSRADNYVSYRKGLGVVCDKEGGFTDDDFVVEFLGEVYPAWKWFEKQDGIRSLQKSSKDVPEFYNIYLERPKGDADGYDILVVDAMHKANYASRICHSCRPNCEAKVTAVGGQYQIGIYSVRPIAFGEEVTFDYNSVTESKEEYEASVCLCGSQVCRGSYLNLTGEGAYDKVLKEWHGLLDKQRLLLEACELNWVSEEDYIDLSRAGLGRCLLGGLPDWLVAYSARLVRFINFERTKLPEKILKHNLEEKKKYNLEISAEMERSDAELQAEGVYSQRLQNLALTLDKVRYVLRCVFGDAKKAPPPLQKLSPEEMVSVLWNGEGSLVDELLQSMASNVDNRVVQDLKLKIRAHDPSSSANVEKELRKSLLWLRDEVRNLTSSVKCRHDAAADLIHVYAYTKSFLKVKEYKSVTSPPVYISPLDLGPKCPTKLSGVAEYCKTYGENYCLGQLIYWHHQTKADPDRELARNSRGCLVLPDFGSFYTKHQKPQRQKLAYGPNAVRYMLARMEKRPQRRWPTDRIWSFKRVPKVFGSPMLDAVLNNSPLEREMVVWLKNRPAMFQGNWDR